MAFTKATLVTVLYQKESTMEVNDHLLTHSDDIGQLKLVPNLSGHGSESFPVFLNGVILQKNNAAIIIAAVITTHHESELRFR